MSLDSHEEQLKMKRCLQELMEYTFISGKSAEIRRHPQEAEMYRFLSGHIDDANNILEQIGYCLRISHEHSLIRIAKDSEIIGETGFKKLNREKFSTDEIKLIYALWDLYRKGSLVHMDVQVTMSDIVDAMKINNIQIGSRALETGMTKLKHYRMIYFTDPTKFTGDRESLPVWIFPAVVFALPLEQIEAVAAEMKEAWEAGPARGEKADEEDDAEDEIFQEG